MQRGRKRLKRTYPSASESDGAEARSSSALKRARHRPTTRASTRVQTRAGQVRSQQKRAHDRNRKADSQNNDEYHARALREPQRQLRSWAARSHSPAAASEIFVEEEPRQPETSPPRAVGRFRCGGRMSESASEQPKASPPNCCEALRERQQEGQPSCSCSRVQ